MIEKPTLVVYVTFFHAEDDTRADSNSERVVAAKLAEDLYRLLTRPLEDPLVWGAGIPIRVASRVEDIDPAEAKHVVVIPVLGAEAFTQRREEAIEAIEGLVQRGTRVLPVLVSANWRTVEHRIPKPLLTELYGRPNPRRATLNEILLAVARKLSGDDNYSLQLFISHAKADLPATGNAAEQIRAYVTSETTGKTFFDKVSILPGEDLTSQIDRQVERGVFVAVRGDRYSSRTWCRRELLRAKQHRLPTLVVEVLSTGEARSAAYGGNGPTVVWDRGAVNGEGPGMVVTLAMVEAVRHLFFLAESSRVVSANDLPPSTERLSRPPELLDLAMLRGRPDASLVVLHPDPPLPTFERALLHEADKRLRLITPTTAFAGAFGSSIQAPLDGWQVALSISDLLGEKSSGGVEGIANERLNDATVFLARALIGMGAAIAYGGDFRDRGFTPLLARLVVDYNETARRHADFLHCYVGATVLVTANDLAYTAHSIRRSSDALLSAPAGDVPAHRASLHFSDMRRVMALRTQARVILGGANRPRSHDLKGYGGRFPGVAEEAWRTLWAGKPLYVAGGFGGAAELVVAALEGDEAPLLLRDSTWAGKQAWSELASAIDGDPDAAKLALPRSQEELAAEIRRYGKRLFASNSTSQDFNGLTLEENRTLFRTRDPLTVAALVAKGLLAVSTREARGKLRVELVEGDLAAASDLEVLVFGSFSDVALDGAGAAIDRLSGGAATRAHQTRTVISSGANNFASFIYAAELGNVSSALNDVVATVRRAALATAGMLRRNHFERVGIVTFMGNVVANLCEVVLAMADGLRRAGSASEFVWFEGDPARAAIIARALESAPDVALTRRTVSAVASPPVVSKKRTVLAVRHEHDELDVALLLHQANGLAPVLRTQLAASERAALAGDASESAPAATELARRGTRIAQLLFGAHAPRLLSAVASSELVILHDASAGGIPYEAMCWTADGESVTPVTSGGLVRHLLAPGVVAERALTRPPRAGKLGILVVINPLEDLPGAEAEGNALLAELNRSIFHVVVLRGPDATVEAVRERISDPSIDVLHYCGHAFFFGPGPDQSGLNCANGRLTLAELRDVQSVPRLAFVNACQAGRVRGSPGAAREPEAFAEFFLRAGVDAYLGAFWLVSDKGAASFAASVYAALTKGVELGDAVIEGRKRLQAASNGDWANYVLYGDARFSLVRGQSTAETRVEVGELPSSSVRIDGGIMVACWVFPTSTAPSSFHVAAVDAETDAAVKLEAPMRVERRESWVGSTCVTTWVVTLAVRPPLAEPIQLRPSAGQPVDIAPATPRATRTLRRTADASPAAQVGQLRALLDQQPDGGCAVLKALMPSACPDDVRRELDAATDDPATRAVWPFAPLFPAPIDEDALAAFVKAYGLSPIDPKEAARQTFQSKEDWAAYAFTRGAIAFVTGGDVQAPLWQQLPDPPLSMTHDVRTGEFAGSMEVALFSDNGNGLHASRAIAQQIVNAKLPYAFHLGDVYYGGSQQEFADYFETPLAPMFDRTELFMITGNHEMYAGGRGFQDLIQRKANTHPKRQRQCGEMFRLRGPGFQVIGIDTMFVGHNARRLRLHDYADEGVLRVLDDWLEPQNDDELTILMTTNQPWDVGSSSTTKLYESLRQHIAGRVDLWFWGNVHYAALYEPWRFTDAGSPARSLIGSCIGHGGYPFYTQKDVGDPRCRWLETKSRFWPDSRIRPDVGANGWCRMKLARSNERWDVHLTYVDWVGRERLRAQLAKSDGSSIRFERLEESDQAAVGGKLEWHAVPDKSPF